MKDKEKQVNKKQGEFEKLEADMQSLERKWIAEQVSFETYNRWHGGLTRQRNYVRAQIITRTAFIEPHTSFRSWPITS